MRCNCCNRQLNEKEITWNNDLQAWEMCGVCLDIAYDAAFSQGFRCDDESGYDSDDDSFIILEDFDDDMGYTTPLSDWISTNEYEDCE